MIMRSSSDHTEVESDPAPTAERSAMMSRVRCKDTAPEIKVRRTAHRLGLRFRLHTRNLPGTPDLVFPRHKLVVFVHGCFWHRHQGCHRCTTPKTRRAFWSQKFERNVERDSQAKAALQSAGWRVLTIWECQTNNERTLSELVADAFRLDTANADQG